MRYNAYDQMTPEAKVVFAVMMVLLFVVFLPVTIALVLTRGMRWVCQNRERIKA